MVGGKYEEDDCGFFFVLDLKKFFTIEGDGWGGVGGTLRETLEDHAEILEKSTMMKNVGFVVQRCAKAHPVRVIHTPSGSVDL